RAGKTVGRRRPRGMHREIQHRIAHARDPVVLLGIEVVVEVFGPEHPARKEAREKIRDFNAAADRVADARVICRPEHAAGVVGAEMRDIVAGKRHAAGEVGQVLPERVTHAPAQVGGPRHAELVIPFRAIRRENDRAVNADPADVTLNSRDDVAELKIVAGERTWRDRVEPTLYAISLEKLLRSRIPFKNCLVGGMTLFILPYVGVRCKARCRCSARCRCRSRKGRYGRRRRGSARSRALIIAGGIASGRAERGARVEAGPYGRQGDRDSGRRRLSHQLTVGRKSRRARYEERDARKQQTLAQHVSPPKMRYAPHRLFPNARSVSYADRRIRTLSRKQNRTRLKRRLGLIYTFERTCTA